MIIDFFQPPPGQRAGGLDLAIKSLEKSLIGSGITVRADPPKETIGQSGEQEVVHFHGLWQPAFPRLAAHCRRRRVPYVVSPHGMLEPWAWRHKWWKKWPYFFVVERRFLQNANRLVATSQIEAHTLKKFFPGSNPTILPLGIAEERLPNYAEAREALAWGESEVIILFLSRIHPKKGLPLLLQTLARLHSESLPQSLRLVVVGGGKESYIRQLKDFIRKHQTELPRIDWVGEVWGEGKWPYLQGADLFCLPSYSENFGYAVLEALQVGTPVLTTSKTPWSEIESWGAGYLVEPNENAIASALRQFFASRVDVASNHRESIAARIRREFSWKALIAKYLKFYADLAGDPAARS